MTGSLTAELEVALRAAASAARLCRIVQAEMVGSDTLSKADKSPVTVADLGSQAIVCRILREAFPKDAILAEESASALLEEKNRHILERATGFVSRLFPDVTPQKLCQWIDWAERVAGHRHWCLDPIDGTKGFLRHDQYAVALALVIQGEVRLGVLACPDLPGDLKDPNASDGVILYAVKDRGAFQLPLEGAEAVRVHVSKCGPGSPSLRICESFESSHSNHEGQARLAGALGITAPSIRMDSQAKYCLVARGDADIYLRLPNPQSPHYKEKVWDHAAGSLLVTEAGGKVTDAHGKPLLFGQGDRLMGNIGVVATNGHVHEEVLDILQEEGLI